MEELKKDLMKLMSRLSELEAAVNALRVENEQLKHENEQLNRKANYALIAGLAASAITREALDEHDPIGDIAKTRYLAACAFARLTDSKIEENKAYSYGVSVTGNNVATQDKWDKEISGLEPSEIAKIIVEIMHIGNELDKKGPTK
jgi:hypothetical protein